MIRMIGIDHTTAPVQVRSLFSFSREEKGNFLPKAKEELSAFGVVLLATCNRTELWVSVADDPETEARINAGPEYNDFEQDPLYQCFCRWKGLNKGNYAAFFRSRAGAHAVEHLFTMACGLRSAILAEDQILTQVGQALVDSRKVHAADSCLEVLFRKAVTGAKKVKTEVAFTRADATAIHQAVSLLKKEGFVFEGRTCMVIGNGEYGKLAARTLRDAGANVHVTVRQYHSGMVHVPAGCREISYDDRIRMLPSCDLVVSATASPHYTLTYDMVTRAELDHPVILIDLAVPEDIEPAIEELEMVTLYNIDSYSSGSVDANDEAYKKALRILDEEQESFWFWMKDRDLVPRIEHVREQAAEDFSLRMHRIIRRLPLSEAEQEKLEEQMNQAAFRTVGKLIYDLQDQMEDQAFRSCVGGMEKIYGQK